AKWENIGIKALKPQVIEKLKVFHIALNTEDDRQPALQRALEGWGEYRQLDWRAGRNRLQDDILRESAFEPHLVFMQIQSDGVVNPMTLQRYKQKTDAFMVNWNGDVRPTPQAWMGQVGEVVDLTLITNKSQIADYESMGCQRVGYLQIGYDEKMFYPKKTKKTQDVIFLGSNYGCLILWFAVMAGRNMMGWLTIPQRRSYTGSRR
ncbi:hypothetical protein LCGC14_2537060, partial [marine sediment metagenome]